MSNNVIRRSTMVSGWASIGGIYIGGLGKSSDQKGLYDWTWKVADGESVAGILPESAPRRI